MVREEWDRVFYLLECLRFPDAFFPRLVAVPFIGFGGAPIVHHLPRQQRPVPPYCEGWQLLLMMDSMPVEDYSDNFIDFGALCSPAPVGKNRRKPVPGSGVKARSGGVCGSNSWLCRCKVCSCRFDARCSNVYVSSNS